MFVIRLVLEKHPLNAQIEPTKTILEHSSRFSEFMTSKDVFAKLLFDLKRSEIQDSPLVKAVSESLRKWAMDSVAVLDDQDRLTRVILENLQNKFDIIPKERPDEPH